MASLPLPATIRDIDTAYVDIFPVKVILLPPRDVTRHKYSIKIPSEYVILFRTELV